MRIIAIITSQQPVIISQSHLSRKSPSFKFQRRHSLRLRNDLDEYFKLKQREKSLEELPSHENGEVAREEATYTHQRSFTEGDAYFKRSRKISNEHKRGITEFSSTTLKHVSDDEKTHKNERAYYGLDNPEDGRRKKFF